MVRLLVYRLSWAWGKLSRMH